jgi:hypothetical protein
MMSIPVCHAEVSYCLAGAPRMGTPRMPITKFITMFLLGTIPYALITTHAGSVSTVDRPTPAMVTTIVLSLFLWGGWFLSVRYKTVNERVEKFFHSAETQDTKPFNDERHDLRFMSYDQLQSLTKLYTYSIFLLISFISSRPCYALK